MICNKTTHFSIYSRSTEPPPMLAGEDVGTRECIAEPPPKWGWTRGAL